MLIGLVAVAAAGAILLGCGAGVPLWHGAHVLSPGAMRVAVGMSSHLTTGGNGRAQIDAARNLADGPTSVSPNAEEVRLRAAAAIIALGPGTAPVVSARIGLPSDSEAGLTYTGQQVRVDARHMFDLGAIAVSVGAALRVHAYSVHDEPYGFDIARQQSVPGIDIPLLVGWQSTSRVMTLWAGARGGYSSASGTVLLESTSVRHQFDLQTWHMGGLVGFAVGFRHLHGVMELDVDYISADGSVGSLSSNVTGVAIAPSGGLAFTF